MNNKQLLTIQFMKNIQQNGKDHVIIQTKKACTILRDYKNTKNVMTRKEYKKNVFVKLWWQNDG